MGRIGARKLAWIGLAGLTCIGCSGLLQPGQLVAEGEVDEDGGTITSAQGDVTLAVPAGAVDGSKAIEVRRLDPDNLPEGVIRNTVVELDPDGTTFDQPVELALRYRQEDLPNPDSHWLRVVQLLPDGTLGRTQFLKHDREARQVKAKLVHFSSYAIADLELAQASFESSEERVDQVDLLMLVDDSRSMTGEQQNLAANFPRLAAKLEAAGLDYRVGVISPNLGAGPHDNLHLCKTVGGLGGKLQGSPRIEGCTPPSDPWLASDGERSNVPGGDVAGAFSCIAQLGPDGCGYEQSLEAMYRALDPAVNPGFIRDDAALAVLFITDEDDCSARDTSLYDVSDFTKGPANFRCFEYGVQCAGITDANAREPGPRQDCKPREDGPMHPISRYVDRLRALKPEGKLVVSLIAGPATPVTVGVAARVGPQGGEGPNLEPSCMSRHVSSDDDNEAFPAIRLKAFADAFGPDRSSFTTICPYGAEADFTPALEQLGDLVVQTHELSWCLPYDPEDTNTTTPELDADCVVDAGALGQVPACDGESDEPCYRVTANADCPNSSSELELVNVRPEDPGADQVKVTCLIP